MPGDLEILARLVVALALTAALGWEREAAGKSAGLRTHMFVGMGAALFVILGDLVIFRFRDHGEMLRSDPLRVIEAVVTAIGFLGAGTIYVSRGRGRVHGLTTAASLWVAAAVGMTVALERYGLAVGTTVLALLVLRILLPLSERVGPASTGDNADE